MTWRAKGAANELSCKARAWAESRIVTEQSGRLAGKAPPDERVLGSGDIQSLADLGNASAVIKEMRSFPFTRQQLLQIAVIASLPGLPLILLVMPVGDLLKLLAGALL